MSQQYLDSTYKTSTVRVANPDGTFIGQAPSVLVNNLGNWNATTNTPAIVSATGTEGDYYYVNVGNASLTIDSIVDPSAGDIVYFQSGLWQIRRASVSLSSVTVSNTAGNPVPVTLTNEVEQSVWVDSTGTYFIRIYTNNLGTPTITYSLADGTVYVPVAPSIPAASGTDKEVVTTHYQVITAGTGYSVGDLVNGILVYDTNLDTLTSEIYYNLTTGAVITPVITELQEIAERLSHSGTNYDSVRLGDGTTLLGINTDTSVKVRPQSVATAPIRYRHAAALNDGVTSGTLITTAATGASFLMVSNSSGYAVDVNIGLSNPIQIGRADPAVPIQIAIPGNQAITITPRGGNLTTGDEIVINVF